MPERDDPTSPGFDAYAPRQIAARAEQVGVEKASLDALTMLALAVLAGAFISLGAQLFAAVVTGSAFGFGPTRLLGGLGFSVGLVLVIVGGAELFTGNNLLTMAWASRKVTARALLRSWAIVFAGNFLGALATAFIVFYSGVWRVGDGGVGSTLVTIAAAKSSLGFVEAALRGVLCNALVCLAVWLCIGARSTADKIAAILLPISGFVACGYEHCVANMYFVPLGILINGATGERAAGIGWGAFLWSNLVPVTLGNVFGGALMVGLVYWFVYLRPRRA